MQTPGPLTGTRILEIGGIGPTPFAGMMLADLGADVIRIDRPGQPGHPVLNRNRRSIVIDLKQPRGVELVTTLAARCDATIEGYRPGVAERLGVGPDALLAANPALVYGRMTGWGQDGPLAQAPGHDINYIALSGALHAIGPADGDPVVPLNLIGDFGGGGMLLAFGVVSGLVQAKMSGTGQVVDAAMVDGSALLMAMTYGFLGQGRWQDQRGVNRLDGGAPWYRVYRCADDEHLAVGCVEPQFYANLLRVLGLVDDPEFARQNDVEVWPLMHKRLEELFLTRPRDAWARLFDGQEACVTPVLSMREALEHPHNLARRTFTRDESGIPQPMPGPRFSMTPPAHPRPAPTVGAQTREVLVDSGLDSTAIDELLRAGVISE
ncbi:CoA transferase [Rhodococcus sp. IEGM 248]|uniref:CaiB/BaiF CoA transferase family protein n=1 Tax=Rhodococcus opacus TaxID=37919 RepID=UPI0013C29585|nr:CaiB/BaiF CoA-transferase family protein [Rhodococcus opacus]MDV7088324.1 CaiB/BaiF CoA-transferase family protein [Rhodococcus opacus]NDV10279.1 CoA transferase [Rhodococcus sp. IEGM 248]